jgi:hypothetical protein
VGLVYVFEFVREYNRIIIIKQKPKQCQLLFEFINI